MNWAADKAAAINITASRMDTEASDFATAGLGNCITRDGQGQPTANLPMATFRHTGVANGVARTDYAAMGQLEDGTVNWAAAGGSADALAATYIPALTALVDGQLCFVRAVAANATTTPTFSPNGLTARTITKIGGASLAAADINATGHEIILRYNLANTRWELLNPAAPIVYSNDAGAGVGPILDLFRDSASPAVNDVIGAVDFNGRDSGAAKQNYARIAALIISPTGAAESGILIFQQVIAGAFTTILQSSATAWNTVLTMALTNATNALALAGGTTAQRSGSPTAGDTRYNTTLNVLEYWDGTRWVISIATTRQYLISGSSATYNTPAGCRSIIVKMIGGGGGGGSLVTNNGSTGGTTTFNSITVIGGGGGVNATSVGRSGGAGGTGGTGSASFRLAGSAGGIGSGSGTPGGGNGGSGLFGMGAGLGGVSGGTAAGNAATANTGAGGGGASSGSTAAGGGGSGEYAEIVIAAPAATYTYTVGAVGAGGVAGTQAGGNGGTGMIIVEEYY